MFENMEMRAVFGAELEKLMASDERIVLADADLSKANGVANIHKKFPKRAFNVGVAEANMASIAAGLAARVHSIHHYLYTVCHAAHLRSGYDLHCLCQAQREDRGLRPWSCGRDERRHAHEL